MTNVKALQAFHIMRQGAVLAVAVLLAKSGLSTDDIGIYEKLLYIGFLLSAFWISGLTQGLLSLFPKLEPSERPVFLWNTYLFLTGLGLLLLGICLVFERQVLLVLTSAPDLPYYRLFIWYLAIQLPAFLLENVYLLKDKPMSNFRFGIFSGLGYLLAVALPPFIGLDFRWSFYGLIGLAVIKHIWLISCLLGLGKPGYDRGIMSRWLMLSWPLVGYALIAGLNQSLDGWLISFQVWCPRDAFCDRHDRGLLIGYDTADFRGSGVGHGDAEGEIPKVVSPPFSAVHCIDPDQPVADTARFQPVI